MFLDLSPLRRHRDFRFLFAGQLVSTIGSFFTFVALPVQIYGLTKSSAQVGLLGTVQLVPLAITALWGGAVADAMDRRKMLLWCEALLMLGSAAMAINAMLPHPSVEFLFLIAAYMSALSGFHTPALTALTPKLVTLEDLPAVSALTSLRNTSASIGGPALAGACIAAFGVSFTYWLDAATFIVSLIAISQIRKMPPLESAAPAGWATIKEGMVYAAGRPELIGTYIVDIVAMTFAMPMAVFPALADQWGGAPVVGYLYSAMSAGALIISIFSRWTAGVNRRGAAVVIAAALWGIAIVGLGQVHSLWTAVLCLVFAGAADMVSGLFRMTIWNETIPSSLRGRMAGIEQLSYMTGPLLGNMRAGFMAERFGLGPSIFWGGLICVAGVTACIPALPKFWHYRRSEQQLSPAESSGDAPGK